MINRRLRDIRESETYRQSVAAGVYQGSAATIVKEVNRHRSHYEWFTDSVPLDETCPFSEGALKNVLVALRQFTPEKRRELSLVCPEALPSAEEFANLLKDKAIAVEERKNPAQGADELLADLLAKNDPHTKSLSNNKYTCYTSFGD